jgi:2-polyprenyl-3-methyl-5-hydroxy-6-metoxy-1,4-benzoquinol methylase
MNLPVTPASPKSFSRYRKQWETNARFDALWAVLTLKEKIGGEWDEEQFFQTGREEIKEVFRFLDENKINLVNRKKCLDFGSGVGRLSFALADYFDEVSGIDISETMVGKARKYAELRGIKNAKFVLSESIALSKQLNEGSFDFVYSNITLQHLERGLQENYLSEFAKLLKKDGIAAIQIPSRRPAPARWNTALKVALSLEWRRIGKIIGMAFRQGIMPWNAQMELNVFPQNELEAKAKELGLKLEAIGFIDWKSFYEATKFSLKSKSNDHRLEYPESPIYCLRKI